MHGCRDKNAVGHVGAAAAHGESADGDYKGRFADGGYRCGQDNRRKAGAAAGNYEICDIGGANLHRRGRWREKIRGIV